MMGKYYAAEEVKEQGRRIRVGDCVHHRLVAVMFNGLRSIAADVTRQSEYDEHYKNYLAGCWLTFDLYDYEPMEVTP